jgi:autotransporter-associated beta strand protein
MNGSNGIAGATDVTFAGSNTVTLNNFNSYTGTTTISGGGTVSIAGSIASPTINVTHGTLQLTANSALSGTPDVTLGNGTTTGVLDIAGTTNAVGGLSGGAGNLVTNTNSAPATLNFAGGCSTFGGVIQDGDSSSGGGPVALNIASGSLTLSGANTYSGGTTVNGGTLAVNGSIAGPVSVNFGGTLAGHGAVVGLAYVAFGGFLAPGNGPTSTGTLTLGSLTLNSGSQTNIKLAGATPGTQYDQVQIGGPLSLDGTLLVSLINGFMPAVGNAFDILTWPTGGLTGTFASLQLPTLSGAEVWDTSQLYNTGELLVVPTYVPGDINRDGKVTVADVSALMTALSDLNSYLAAHPELSGPDNLPLLMDVADVNNDGSIDNLDIQALISLLANNAASGGGGGAIAGVSGNSELATVPEPASMALAVMGMVCIVAAGQCCRFRRQASLPCP